MKWLTLSLTRYRYRYLLRYVMDKLRRTCPWSADLRSAHLQVHIHAHQFSPKEFPSFGDAWLPHRHRAHAPMHSEALCAGIVTGPILHEKSRTTSTMSWRRFWSSPVPSSSSPSSVWCQNYRYVMMNLSGASKNCYVLFTRLHSSLFFFFLLLRLLLHHLRGLWWWNYFRSGSPILLSSPERPNFIGGLRQAARMRPVFPLNLIKMPSDADPRLIEYKRSQLLPTTTVPLSSLLVRGSSLWIRQRPRLRFFALLKWSLYAWMSFSFILFYFILRYFYYSITNGPTLPLYTIAVKLDNFEPNLDKFQIKLYTFNIMRNISELKTIACASC